MLDSSKLFDEFIMRRCEEILQDDVICQELNKAIVATESEFKKTLNSEQLKKYNELEEIIVSSMAHSEFSIYKQSQFDRV